jgi:hypothetical protein
MMQRQGGWIKTYTGMHFYPMDPREEEIEIEDIAHALSNICRWTGHCRVFYSVAQHCLVVANELQRLGRYRLMVLAGLLHDASEAYLTDIPSPIKPFLTGYKKAERRLEECIARKFMVPYPWPKEVKEVDEAALGAEARDLVGGTDDWIWTPSELPLVTNPVSPEVAKRLFMSKFNELK